MVQDVADVGLGELKLARELRRSNTPRLLLGEQMLDEAGQESLLVLFPVALGIERARGLSHEISLTPLREACKAFLSRGRDGRYVAVRDPQRLRVLGGYLRRKLLAELDELDITRDALARELGCSGAHISNVLSGSRGVGPEFVDAAARRWGMSRVDLETEAVAEWKRLNPYPNRAIAAALCREASQRNPDWREDAIAAVERETPQADFEVADWVVRIWLTVGMLDQEDRARARRTDTPRSA